MKGNVKIILKIIKKYYDSDLTNRQISNDAKFSDYIKNMKVDESESIFIKVKEQGRRI